MSVCFTGGPIWGGCGIWSKMVIECAYRPEPIFLKYGTSDRVTVLAESAMFELACHDRLFRWNVGFGRAWCGKVGWVAGRVAGWVAGSVMAPRYDGVSLPLSPSSWLGFLLSSWFSARLGQLWAPHARALVGGHSYCCARALVLDLVLRLACAAAGGAAAGSGCSSSSSSCG
jgi:hypothetical protein